MDGRDVARAQGGVREPLIVVAQVDDRPYAMLDERCPARGRQPIKSVRAHDSAATRHAPVTGRQTTEITDVENSPPS